MNRAAFRLASAGVLAAAIVGATGCEQLNARKANRDGNKAYQEQHYVEAAAQYEKALKTVDDPKVHYNLGLAYKAITRPGFDGPIKLDVAGSFACTNIPKTSPYSEKVCIREGDTRFLPCSTDKECPTEKHHCQDTQFCALTTAQTADMSAQHLQGWLKANPDDSETQKLMTQVWVESNAYEPALAYWEARHKDKPTDTNIMGTLAGLYQKAGDWRKGVEWYRKMAEASTDATNKLAAYTYIGRVSRAKLAGKTLSPADSIELADDGIGALQAAQALDPKNAATYGLMGAIFSLRGTIHGTSWAGGIDRASMQDLLAVQRVLFLEAKKAEQGLPAPGAGSAATPAAPAPSTPSPKTGG